MGRPSTFRLGYAAKLSLAAMTLLLPLVVFMVILVHDRDAQTDARTPQLLPAAFAACKPDARCVQAQEHSRLDEAAWAPHFHTA